MTITSGEDGEIIFWQFKNKHFSTKNLNITNYVNKIKLNEPINQVLLHRERLDNLLNLSLLFFNLNPLFI